MNAPNYTHALARTLQQKADKLGLSVADYLAFEEDMLRFEVLDRQAEERRLFETGQMDLEEEALYRKSREENSHE